MRCKICQIAHKNTARSTSWEEQLCRFCNEICDYFSWNGSYLQNYWRIEK
jgi:hypothetical protein